MDGATMQAKIYAGRAKAAAVIGLPYRQYRPLTAAAPLGNLLATINAAFNAGDRIYRAPNLPGDAIWYGDFDGRVTQPGDYLVRVSGGQTYFIAGQQQLLPIVCVDCNGSVHIVRQQAQAAVGALGYGGNVTATQVDVLGTSGAMWPASILFGGRSLASPASLPAGVKETGWRIMLPPSASATILAGDIVIDNLGRRFAVEGAERTDLGWRVQAQEVHT